MIDVYAFSLTQRCMLRILADGKPHHVDELLSCLMDELGERRNVRPHLCRIRKRLRLHGQDIVPILIRRRLHYQWIAHIRNAA